MSGLPRPCRECGDLVVGFDTCAECRPKRIGKPKPSATRRGYGYRWEQLSKRAREVQPFCSDCGSTENLSVDHSPEAWERVENGKTLTLRDFKNGLLTVVCARCQKRRGNARGTNVNRTSNRQNHCIPVTPRL